jgi:hypothetical protein
MLKIVWKGNSMPTSWPVAPSDNFQPGMIGQLKSLGNNIVCGVSDGTAPLGVIDDIKTNAFSTAAIDEVVISPAMGVLDGSGQLVTPVDIKQELNNPNIMPYSFVTTVEVELLARNGVITFPAGTPLNFDASGTGTPNAIRTVVSYTYQVPNIPGDNSTAGSGHITIWLQRFVFQTDQFETNQAYPLNAPLFVSESGLLTTRRPDSNVPGVAIVTGAPNALFSTIEALWL